MLDQLQWECLGGMWVGSCGGGRVFVTGGVGTGEDLEWTILNENSSTTISIFLQSCGIQEPNKKCWTLMLCQLQWWWRSGVKMSWFVEWGVLVSVCRSDDDW